MRSPWHKNHGKRNRYKKDDDTYTIWDVLLGLWVLGCVIGFLII